MGSHWSMRAVMWVVRRVVSVAVDALIWVGLLALVTALVAGILGWLALFNGTPLLQRWLLTLALTALVFVVGAIVFVLILDRRLPHRESENIPRLDPPDRSAQGLASAGRRIRGKQSVDGWLYLVELSIVNREQVPLRLLPYLVVDLVDPGLMARPEDRLPPSEKTLRSCDLRTGQRDPWGRQHDPALPSPDLRVDVLNTNAFFLPRDTQLGEADESSNALVVASIRDDHQPLLDRPVLLSGLDEARGWVAFRLPLLALPVTGAGFLDKDHQGQLVNDRLPPSRSLILGDTLSDREWVRPQFNRFEPDFYEHLQAIHEIS